MYYRVTLREIMAFTCSGMSLGADAAILAYGLAEGRYPVVLVAVTLAVCFFAIIAAVLWRVIVGYPPVTGDRDVIPGKTVGVMKTADESIGKS